MGKKRTRPLGSVPADAGLGEVMTLHVVDTHRDIPRRVGVCKNNAELQSVEQNYSDDPLTDRATDLYRREFVVGFADKWDELIDWDARAKSEGQFFIDILRADGKKAPRCRHRHRLSFRPSDGGWIRCHQCGRLAGHAGQGN